MGKSIPERWLDYSAFGDIIEGTKILTFKVPLKEPVVKSLPLNQRFCVRQLLEAFPRLKCVVDLTCTYRYYDPKEFTDKGIRYEKLIVPGHQVPNRNIVAKFLELMEDLISSCGKDDIIGVHCTHGVNRTGYLVCRYLVQRLNWTVENSLKVVQEARGYPIERETYVKALYRTV